MPFSIWCAHCPSPTLIGQGVRFNAEKKRVGNYYTTPIWSFKLKHTVCGGEIEVRTDPKKGRRMGLGIELLPETEEDAKRARLVDFGGVDAREDKGVDKALSRPLFMPEPGEKRRKSDANGPAKAHKKLKSEIAASRMRESLVSEIVSNTRAAKDPFLDFGSREITPRKSGLLPGLRRKRVEEGSPIPSPVATSTSTIGTPSSTEKDDTPKAAAGTTALVGYDSDSD
ncbi:Protein saf4 [Collariella sp. IMI 366227]|nr:Protein saf4 [Collariella sp. IMI 366227]